MIPVRPVVPGQEDFELVYAANQSEYVPLPVLRTEHSLLCRWKLDPKEREHIAAGGDLFVCVLHFGQNLQPLMPIADTPERAMEIMIQTEADL